MNEATPMAICRAGYGDEAHDGLSKAISHSVEEAPKKFDYRGIDIPSVETRRSELLR
jgi:hypothetical protein